MDWIKNFLFGNKYRFKDDIIGELTTRAKNKNPSINYTWVGEHLLNGQKKATVFILEGNINGPHKSQLNSVHQIVHELENLIQKVKSQLKAQENINKRFRHNWENDFYLAAITPYAHNVNKFEVNFEPLVIDDTSYISLIWENSRISEVEAG